MCKKIDEVHEGVKETNAKITKQNGRLGDVEVKVDHVGLAGTDEDLI